MVQPIIIKKDKLPISGFTGDGSQTGKVWEDFDSAYKSKPFIKAEEHGYEIRFYDGEKSVQKGKDIHVGFLTNDPDTVEGFSTIILPSAEYAVFDVYVAKGYDSGNSEMDKWLKDNASTYKQMLMDGVGHVSLPTTAGHRKSRQRVLNADGFLICYCLFFSLSLCVLHF